MLNKERMFEICKEVWDSIPIEDFRPYMTKVAANWKEIKKRKGEWVGWSSRSKKVRHGYYA